MQVGVIVKLWRQYRMRGCLEQWGKVRRRRLHQLDRQWAALAIQR